MSTIRIRVASSLLAIAISCIPEHMAVAADMTRVRYDIPAEPLGAALLDVGRIAGRQILFPAEEMQGLSAPALHGDFSPEEAVAKLLGGRRFTVESTPTAIYVRGLTAAIRAEDGGGGASAIVVTGSRIRGAAVASPVISLSRQEMLNAGETNLGEVVRDIPQSFAGGANPGVLADSGSVQNDNLDSSSTINLRGLGPDATLTLLNGHRLSYDGAAQGVDVSAIPVAAVDRLEIVADGASAIYGSDAVGGVANIILRRDYDGVLTESRLGSTPDGGDFQQQYDVVAGRRWGSGGFIATYNFERDTEIDAGQRSFTQNIDASTTLLPYQRQHSGVLSGHQSLGSDFDLSIDGTFNHRFSRYGFAYDTVPYRITGEAGSRSTTAFSIAPRLEWHAPHDWLVTVSGVYGVDRTHYDTVENFDGALDFDTAGRYRNTSKIAEVSAEGPVLVLPAGRVRFALGAGYRTVSLTDSASAFDGVVRSLLVDSHESRSSAYGYGELFVPLVAPSLDIAGIDRLEATAAMRYESYGDLGREGTPKFGLIYAPVHDLTLRGSWGKSFKTPTLYQQYNGYTVTLFSPAQLAASGIPAGSSVLFAGGSNPDLRSERATSWTVGAELTPEWIPGLSIEGSFFKIDYRDRINELGLHTSGALTNPEYQALITLLPDQSVVDAIVSGARQPLSNISGGPFDPSNVFAFFDDRYRNVSRQTIKGVDLAMHYAHPLGDGQSLSLSASASYLRSSQILVDGSAPTQLAGTIYNPPKWRARGGGSWTIANLTASAFVNYIGSVIDDSQQPFERVGSMTTLDATLRVASSDEPGWLKGLAMTLAVSNMFDAKPQMIRVGDPIDPAYDSTNYSAVGRLISVTLSKRW